MKILYLHPSAWSGEYAILRKLVSLGHTVSAIEEARGSSGPSRWFADHYAERGDEIATLWYDPGRGAEKLLTWPVDRVFKRGFEGRNLAHRMLLIRAALAEFNPDAIVASDGFSYAIPAAFLRRLGILKPRLMVSYIGGDILDCPEAEVGKRRTYMTNWLIRSSVGYPDVLRPVSPLVRDRLLADGADPARISVIPSHLVADLGALDDVLLSRDLLSTSIRRRHDLSASAPVVVTLGGNQKGKGLQILAMAWPRVLAAIPSAKWLVCGPESQWLLTNVKPLLNRLGIESSVCMVGRLEGRAVFEYLASADFHVNPSLCESLNMATVEAAAVGTPTVSSDGAGIAAWIERFGAGCVVPKGGVLPLADAIISGLSSRAKRDQWSAAGRAMAAEFSMDRISGALLDCLAPVSKNSR